MIELILQKQPTPTTCAQTCIAMAMGVPVSEVIDRFGGNAMDERSLLRALEDCRLRHNQFVFSDLIATGWYFAVVPSLNIPGGNHQVLIHFDSETGDLKILDPSPGKAYSENGLGLKSWSQLVLFIPGGKPPQKG